MTTKELQKKLEGVMKITPSISFDDTIIIENEKGLLRIAEEDKLVKCNSDGEIEKILNDIENVSGEDIKKWYYEDIPESLLLNSYILSNTSYEIISKVFDLPVPIKSKNLNTFQYSWMEDRWFLKAQFSVTLISGENIIANIEIDSTDVINFNGKYIGYIDLEDYIKKFYILTVTENIDNIDERLINGINKL